MEEPEPQEQKHGLDNHRRVSEKIGSNYDSAADSSKSEREFDTMQRSDNARDRQPGSGYQRLQWRRRRGQSEFLVEMEGVKIMYGSTVVLGKRGRGKGKGLRWSVRRGERWGLFGPNGKTKTNKITISKPRQLSPLRLGQNNVIVTHLLRSSPGLLSAPSFVRPPALKLPRPTGDLNV